MPPSWIETFRWPLVLLTGILLVLALPPFAFSTLGWVALIPAWWLITRSPSVRAKPWRYGYGIGLLYFGGVFWWISNVTVVGMLFLMFYLAIYPAVWFFLLKWLYLGSDAKKPMPHFTLSALVASSFWVTLEWWRSWFLTGFDWNQLGVTQAPSLIFRQLASVGGVPFLSFVLVLVNLLWAEGIMTMLERMKQRAASVRPALSLWSALLILSLGFAYGWKHLQRHAQDETLPRLTYACVQPAIPQVHYTGGPYSEVLKQEDAALLVEKSLSFQAIQAHPDLLIWPECTVSQGVFQDRPMNETVMEIVRHYSGQFLLGSQDIEQSSNLSKPKYYNAAYLIRPENGDFRFQLYYKTYLVVWGEYMPLGDTFPMIRRWIGMGTDMSRGPGPKLFHLVASGLNFAPLICFEDTVAPVVDRAAALKPDFLVTITNDGWYQGTCAVWGLRQHLNNAIFRTVEHDLPLVRCGNNGISCEVDQNGTIVSAMQDEKGHVVEVRGVFFHTLVAYPSRGTLYEIFGNGIVLLSELITAILGFCFLVRLPSALIPPSRE